MDAFKILEIAAGGSSPVRISVVEVVPVELRLLAVVEVEVRNLVRLVAGAADCITDSRPEPPKIEFYYPKVYLLFPLYLIPQQIECEIRSPALRTSK